MANSFEGYGDGLESPPRHGFEVTPDDATDLPHVTRCINVATSGSVMVTTLGGDTHAKYVAAGIQYSGRFTRIWATGTTATGIVGEY